jgi:hypothetical protein
MENMDNFRFHVWNEMTKLERKNLLTKLKKYVGILSEKTAYETPKSIAN